MALKSFRITKKELETYYTPKTSDYTLMVNSINSKEYGQIIQQYEGNTVLNTYYHIWDDNFNYMVVYNKIQNLSVHENQAGPVFFGVSSEQGIMFLDGALEISGLRKLKYCDGCSDGNGLKKPVIENFKKRFTQVKELILGNNLLEGFLFYDFSLPRYQNVFPAAKIDDGVNVNYKFKNIDGNDLTVEDVSIITSKPIGEIEISVDDAPIVKPQEGENTVIVSCCDKNIYHIIRGQMDVGTYIGITQFPTESRCWYVESLTNEPTDVFKKIELDGKFRSCESCIKIYGCPSPGTSSIIRHCCNGTEYAIDGVYPVGTVLYTKDVEPAECYKVINTSTDEPTIKMEFTEYRGSCKDCAANYPGGCK
jgi:hypothetical protein